MAEAVKCEAFGTRNPAHGLDQPVLQAGEVRPDFPAAYPRTDVQRSVYFTYTDLCEIGFELAQGFLQHSRDWGMWCVSNWQSWLDERRFYRATPQTEVFTKEIIRAADLIHLGEYHNYPMLKDLPAGKKMVMHHHGCAYRDDPLRFERREIEAGYLRLVSTPDLLIHGSARGRRTLRWLPSPINCREIERNYPRGERADERVRVLHAYTIAANKGSDLIADMMARLPQKRVQFDMYTGVQRRESLWHIRQCDIYIATMLYGPGMASLEAMAMGIPVVLGCTADELVAQKECYGEDLPFVYVTEQTLERTVRGLCADKDLREGLGRRGQEAVRRLHDVPTVVKRLAALYAEARPCNRVIYERPA